MVFFKPIAALAVAVGIDLLATARLDDNLHIVDTPTANECSGGRGGNRQLRNRKEDWKNVCEFQFSPISHMGEEQTSIGRAVMGSSPRRHPNEPVLHQRCRGTRLPKALSRCRGRKNKGRPSPRPKLRSARYSVQFVRPDDRIATSLAVHVPILVAKESLPFVRELAQCKKGGIRSPSALLGPGIKPTASTIHVIALWVSIRPSEESEPRRSRLPESKPVTTPIGQVAPSLANSAPSRTWRSKSAAKLSEKQT